MAIKNEYFKYMPKLSVTTRDILLNLIMCVNTSIDITAIQLKIPTIIAILDKILLFIVTSK